MRTECAASHALAAAAPCGTGRALAFARQLTRLPARPEGCFTVFTVKACSRFTALFYSFYSAHFLQVLQ